MAIVNRSFSVNVTPGMMPPIVHVSEYDVGRAYTVSILDEQGNTFTIPSGTTASIEGTLNGSVGFTQSATVSNNQVSFTLSQSMTAYSGKAWCKIKLAQNSQPIQTCAFVLAIDRAGVESGTIIGAPGFEEQVQDAVDNYLDDHPVGIEVDPTLTVSGAAADAKVTGDKVAELNSALLSVPSPKSGATPVIAIWENGAINATSGQDETGRYNRRTAGYIPIFGWATFVSHNASNHSVQGYLYEYDENKVFLGRQSSNKGDLTPSFDNCKYVRFMTFSESVAVDEQEQYITLEYVTVNETDAEVALLGVKLSTATAENGETTPISLTWENGAINNNGQNAAGPFNRRTVNYIPVYEWTTFVSHNSSNGTVYVYLNEYDENYTYLGVHNSTRADLSPQYENCKYIRMMTFSESVAVAEQDSYISAEYITVNETADNVHKLESSLNLLAEPSVLYMTDRLEVGATKNNDSGNTTYIYKTVVRTTLDEYKVIGIKCSNVKLKGERTLAFVIYERDANNTRTDTNVTINDALRGFILKPKADTVAIQINFYPSISGGLVDEYAFVEDLVIVANNDGRFAINGYSYADRFALPAYYYKNNYIDGKIDVIATLMKNADSDCDAFMFCTDQHWILNAQNSPKLIKYINERIPIPRLFMGGDYADGINTFAYNAYRDAYNGKIYNVFGNHEYMSYYTDQNKVGTAKTIIGADVWTYMNNGITDAVEGVASRGYCYVDNPMKKMRYIILSVFDKINGSVTMLFDSDQLSWFTNVALDMPDGYTAVVFGHYFASQPYGTDTVTKPSDLDALFAAVDANKSKIACLIAGHTHVDLVTQTDGGVPIFVTTCDKYMPWIENGVNREPFLSEYRIPGTITEQAFDVVVIDKKNRLISFVRIGAKADNGSGERLELRQRNY